MSIKIGEAYKLRDPNQLPELMHDIRTRGQQQVHNTLTEVYRQLMRAVRKDTPLWRSKAERIKQEWGIRLDIAHDLVMRMYRRTSTSLVRSPFNFDVWVAMHYFRGYWVLIPHADWLVKDALNFMGTDSRLEDFHYHDNRDQTSGVSADHWAERAVWYDALDAVNGWADQFLLVINDWNHFTDCDPWFEMLRDFHQNGGPSGIQTGGL